MYTKVLQLVLTKNALLFWELHTVKLDYSRLSYNEFPVITNIKIKSCGLVLQWKPLNVITDNVIIWLMLSHSKSPVLFIQISNRKIRLLWSNCLKIWLLFSVLPQNWGFFFKNYGKSDYCYQFFFKNVNCELFSLYFGNNTAKM